VVQFSGSTIGGNDAFCGPYQKDSAGVPAVRSPAIHRGLIRRLVAVKTDRYNVFDVEIE
jgi:hypothetical protein